MRRHRKKLRMLRQKPRQNALVKLLGKRRKSRSESSQPPVQTLSLFANKTTRLKERIKGLKMAMNISEEDVKMTA